MSRPIDAYELRLKGYEVYEKYCKNPIAKEALLEIEKLIVLAPTIEQPKWISCEERLPDCEWGAECTEPVIYKMKATGTVYAGYYGTGGLCRDRYFRQYHKINTNGVDVDDVACWMYQSALPEPPKEST